MKISRIAIPLILCAAAAGVIGLSRLGVRSPQFETRPPDAISTVAPGDSAPLQPVTASEPLQSKTVPAIQPEVTELVVESPAAPINKLDRLAQIREAFRALAAGDKTNALRTARQIVDQNEREVALLTLVTEWTQGELGPPQLRAERIARVGLEAGLGMELAKHPELALLWADELTEGDGRANVLQMTARFMVNSDPAAAFALSQRFPEADRRGFSDAIFSNWASHDTAAALKWAEHFQDAAEREAAFQAIRSVAPVGIGTALEMKDGYPVIRDLIQGTPAQLSGQLQVGDRIIALAQGGGPFVDAYDAPLAEIVQAVRGAPNTLLKLKVLPAGAAPNTPPRTVLIMRDQIKFKK